MWRVNISTESGHFGCGYNSEVGLMNLSLPQTKLVCIRKQAENRTIHRLLHTKPNFIKLVWPILSEFANMVLETLKMHI